MVPMVDQVPPLLKLPERSLGVGWDSKSPSRAEREQPPSIQHTGLAAHRVRLQGLWCLSLIRSQWSRSAGIIHLQPTCGSQRQFKFESPTLLGGHCFHSSKIVKIWQLHRVQSDTWSISTLSFPGWNALYSDVMSYTESQLLLILPSTHCCLDCLSAQNHAEKPSILVLLKLQGPMNHLRILLKLKKLIQEVWEGTWDFCISNKLPGDTNAAGTQATVWGARL